MPEINSTADLTSILSDWDTRLRKLERQVAVPRIAYSFVATKESLSSGTPLTLATPDTVTLTVNANTLVSFYLTATLEGSGPTSQGVVYIRDETAAKNYQVLSQTGTSASVMVSQPGSSVGVLTTSGSPLGGFVTLYVTTAGPSTFSLRYTGGSGTVSFSNRLLVAIAQPL